MATDARKRGTGKQSRKRRRTAARNQHLYTPPDLRNETWARLTARIALFDTMASVTKIVTPAPAQEWAAFQRDMKKVQHDRPWSVITELLNYWERKGLQLGRLEGSLAILHRLLPHTVGPLPLRLQKKLKRLTFDKMQRLAEVLLDFTDPRDLDRWLANGSR